MQPKVKIINDEIKEEKNLPRTMEDVNPYQWYYCRINEERYPSYSYVVKLGSGVYYSVDAEDGGQCWMPSERGDYYLILEKVSVEMQFINEQ